jgi:hypothetical protein
LLEIGENDESYTRPFQEKVSSVSPVPKFQNWSKRKITSKSKKKAFTPIG